MDLKQIVRDVLDFPKEGIIFRDITPVLQSPEALKESIDQMMDKLDGVDFDLIVGPESRGFIFGVPLAYNMNKGFIPVRKKGKLPYKTVEKEYDLEYGTASIEMHIDAIQPGQKVVIIDDLLATGGTSKAIIDLIEQVGGKVVKLVYLIELEFLKGRDALKDYSVESIIKY
ncbi:MAG: adenine phosphoribosyltransferase [Epulopiscium sp.]|jgi:adenine phosphoribosyltransferase|uniref:Adenine phosphoribosyltransferase n=1 Tax=Defluviitalea raffinosedens TaxID=1450156 RepID=A0A7C8LER1_9FIRM|nr:adenine phosphoribosyltransferase [Defluviitalea raffinosedens]MBZ4669140.1 apt [Defluviitaleaceae bacterium]MDK2787058.1 adenine phosphoribosyltransferase [Candidatus Epulonipiscium sp.]KAE9634439.1 adenine phosphoribosyltransferase [Defluviitalea raffinosedens]MBM7684766.1 adenine phosphoribosyltransferase [Defluviitalea raffinosedens]HHW66996.1 adenine phosphoribosyltransferase [Candidatus Epulonipiscium sp.]